MKYEKIIIVHWRFLPSPFSLVLPTISLPVASELGDFGYPACHHSLSPFG